MLIVLMCAGCESPESNMFCADRCRESGGMMYSAAGWGEGGIYCQCAYPKGSIMSFRSVE